MRSGEEQRDDPSAHASTTASTRRITRAQVPNGRGVRVQMLAAACVLMRRLKRNKVVMKSMEMG